MAITKPDLSQQWASDGDKIAPAPGKIQTGWGPEIPPYQWENWIQGRQDQMLAHINERGVPEWDGLTEYLADGKSYVQGSNGKIYKSVLASGPATTTQDPVTDNGAYWQVAFLDNDGSYTKAEVDALYALTVKKDSASSTGAANLPIGNTGQRPASPVDGMIRYNSSLNQFEGYQNGAWGQIGGDYANLSAAVQTLNGQVDFTIIYPNGGSASSPATVVANTRYVENNPFPGFRVLCTAEVQIDGVWSDPSIMSPGGTTAYGVKATQYGDADIVVRTLLSGVHQNPSLNGSAFPASVATASAPCRVKVWKVKGAIV